MKNSDFENKTLSELNELVLKERRVYLKYRIGKVLGDFNKVHLLKEKKKYIARMYTYINNNYKKSFSDE